MRLRFGLLAVALVVTTMLPTQAWAACSPDAAAVHEFASGANTTVGASIGAAADTYAYLSGFSTTASVSTASFTWRIKDAGATVMEGFGAGDYALSLDPPYRSGDQNTAITVEMTAAGLGTNQRVVVWGYRSADTAAPCAVQVANTPLGVSCESGCPATTLECPNEGCAVKDSGAQQRMELGFGLLLFFLTMHVVRGWAHGRAPGS